MPERSVHPIEAFPFRTSAEIRFSDLDAQGHVNNAVYATFSEIGASPSSIAPTSRSRRRVRAS